MVCSNREQQLINGRGNLSNGLGNGRHIRNHISSLVLFQPSLPAKCLSRLIRDELKMASTEVTEQRRRQDKMQFLLKSGGRCGPRIGTLLWTTSTGSPAPPLETPLCLLYSRGGAVPNLTRDLEEEVTGRRTGHMTDHMTGSENAVMLTVPTMYMK